MDTFTFVLISTFILGLIIMCLLDDNGPDDPRF